MKKVNNRMYFSDKKSAEKEENLKKQGVTHVVSLAGKIKEFEKITYKSFHFPDRPDFEIREIIRQVCEYLKPIYGKSKVLVHCMGGMSRSPSVVIGVLMVMEGMPYQKAYQMVRQSKPSIQIHFQEQLKKLDIMYKQ